MNVPVNYIKLLECFLNFVEHNTPWMPICQGLFRWKSTRPERQLTMKKPGNHPPHRSRELHLDVCLLATQPAVKEPSGKRQKQWTTKSGKEWEVSKLGVQSFTIFKMLYIYIYTALKVNMELKNHLIEKGKSSSKPAFLGSMWIFQGVPFQEWIHICP